MTSFSSPLRRPSVAAQLPRKLECQSSCISGFRGLFIKPGRLTRYTQSRPGLPGHEGTIRRGLVNCCGVKCRFLIFSPRVQACKQARGSFRKCFDWLLGLFVHDEQSSTELTGLCPEIFSIRSRN